MLVEIFLNFLNMFGFGYIYDFFFICVPCDFPFYADLLNDRKCFHKQMGPYDFFENEMKILSELKKLKQLKKLLSPFYVQSAVTKCYQGFKNPFLHEIWSLTAFQVLLTSPEKSLNYLSLFVFLQVTYRLSPKSKLLELTKNVSTGFCL